MSDIPRPDDEELPADQFNDAGAVEDDNQTADPA